MSSSIHQMTPTELHDLLAGSRPPVLIDVREEEETQFGVIANSRLIPMDQLEAEAAKLDPAETYVIYCRSGRRSQTAAEYLASQGFGNVSNLEGGILAWGREVDSTIIAY